MIGDPGTSMFTLVRDLCFSVIVLGWTPPHNFRIPIAVVIASWGYRVLLLGAAKATESPDASLFGPTPYWCWFAERYQYGRIPGSFLWYWLLVIATGRPASRSDPRLPGSAPAPRPRVRVYLNPYPPPTGRVVHPKRSGSGSRGG